MKKIIVNKFSATWCGPCRVMKKTVDKVKEMEEFKEVTFNEYDVDEDSSLDLVNKFSIKSLPTLIICDENNEEIGKIIGNVTEAFLVQSLKDYING